MSTTETTLPSPENAEIRPAKSASRIISRLALKPYGDELLTRGADFWIFSARLIILAMAAAEAMAWGYMGALISRSAPLVTAVIAGAFVFTLIWIIDATFMTLDLSRAFYERVLLGKQESPMRERARLIGGIAARVAIVSASLFITAPFLAQAIFAGDVRDEMAKRNATLVAAKRQEIQDPFAARTDELQREQKRLEEQRVLEAAGVGPSGKFGRGPALETIERQLVEKRSEIAALEASRLNALARYDRLSPTQLEQQYGLRFLAPGVHASGELLNDLLKSERFAGAELAVRAFLAFLFLGLLILKLFQPRSVAVYFSEQLHSIYDEYRRGLVDDYLPVGERAAAGGNMEPLRFEDWCVNTYAGIRNEDARRRETAREQRVHQLLVEQWRGLQADAQGELDPLLRRRDAASAAIDELEAELHRLRASAATPVAELQKVDTARQSMREHISRGGMDSLTFEQAMAATRDLEERRRTLARAVSDNEHAVETATRRIEMRRREAALLGEEIAIKQAVISHAEQRIGDERVKLATAVAQQRELWDSAGRPAVTGHTLATSASKQLAT